MQSCLVIFRRFFYLFRKATKKYTILFQFQFTSVNEHESNAYKLISQKYCNNVIVQTVVITYENNNCSRQVMN